MLALDGGVCQCHATAALPPEKEPNIQIGQETELAPEQGWTQWQGEKVQPSAFAILSHTRIHYSTLSSFSSRNSIHK
jgi:hypothetical protein